MAKAKGPLHSLGARGQIGKSLIFSKWKGISTIRAHTVPSNPETPAQMTWRGAISLAMEWWNSSGYTVADFAAYNLTAQLQSRRMTGFNFFVGKMAPVILGDTYPFSVKAFTVLTNTGGAIVFSVDTAKWINVYAVYGRTPTALTHTVQLTQGGSTRIYTSEPVAVVPGQSYFFRLCTGTPLRTPVVGLYKVRALA